MKELPARRPYDAAYTVCTLTLTGVTPLLMNSGEVDRDGELYLAYQALATSRGLTAENKARLRELEWYTRLYHDEKLGPYVPGKNVKELLRNAATIWKKGEHVKRSLVIPDYRIPLIYDGPREAATLWQAGYRYTAMVATGGIGRGRIERCRPCFDEWGLSVELAFDPTELDLSTVENIVGRSVKYGLGDYRPEFGAFTATLDVVKTKRGDAKANGSKAVDAKAKRAIKAHAERVMA